MGSGVGGVVVVVVAVVVGVVGVNGCANGCTVASESCGATSRAWVSVSGRFLGRPMGFWGE